MTHNSYAERTKIIERLNAKYLHENPYIEVPTYARTPEQIRTLLEYALEKDEEGNFYKECLKEEIEVKFESNWGRDEFIKSVLNSVDNKLTQSAISSPKIAFVDSIVL